MKTRSFSERLDDKSAQALLTNHFRERYNYNPAMTEAIFQDAVFVRTLLDPTAREDGQIIRYFPRATEPAGKPLKDCEYVAVRLTLYAADDAEFSPKALTTCGRAQSQGSTAAQTQTHLRRGPGPGCASYPRGPGGTARLPPQHHHPGYR